MVNSIVPDTCSSCKTGSERDAFGNWLSGFVDGEGSFQLVIIRNKRPNKVYTVPTCRFEICMRKDDRPILEEIQRFLGVGYVYSKTSSARATKITRYHVTSAVDAMKALVPHFDRYPLRAKKRHDYAIWRQGVAMIYEKAKRPPVSKGCFGSSAKYTEEEQQEFARLAQLIRTTREFVDPDEVK